MGCTFHCLLEFCVNFVLYALLCLHSSCAIIKAGCFAISVSQMYCYWKCSSARCRMLVCSVWLWYFLIILTYFFKNLSLSIHMSPQWVLLKRSVGDRFSRPQVAHRTCLILNGVCVAPSPRSRGVRLSSGIKMQKWVFSGESTYSNYCLHARIRKRPSGTGGGGLTTFFSVIKVYHRGPIASRGGPYQNF